MPSKKAKGKQKPTKVSGKGRRAGTAYSKRSLAAKLGLKDSASKAILEAPEDFQALLGSRIFDTSLELESYDYLHFFTASKYALEAIFPILAKRLNPGGILWISWPKKSSGKQTDLGEGTVREIGLATGLVDVKISAINELWSGLKFMHRRMSSLRGN